MIKPADAEYEAARQVFSGTIDRRPAHIIRVADAGGLRQLPGRWRGRADPDDRRRHIVEITPRGKKVLERAERGMDKLEQELLSALSPSERAKLKQLVRRVLESQAASARQPEVARP